MHTLQTSLELQDLRFKMLIGCNEEEKILQQEISVYIKISFLEAPLGCKSDNIGDTLCYDKITNIIREVCNLKHYHLIEHLGWQIYQQLKNNYSDKITIKINKLNPPIDELKGGAQFTIEG
jgi:dihydroneopterin aldolase